MNGNKSQVKYIQASLCNSIDVDVSKIKRYKRRKTEYYNYPVAFDIETSSFYDGDEPRACMYVWQLCLGDSEQIIVGRTWEEFTRIIRLIRKHFHTSSKRVLILWVHNLAYEFQFIRKLFKWQKVFSLDKRVPLYALTPYGIEFRCSYRLSGYSLETVAKNLLHHDFKKLVGNLDYTKIRHSTTPLTKAEMDYNIADVQIVCAYIAERIEIDGNITKLPLTKTGYVRNACKVACYGSDHKKPKYYKYRKFMNELTMTPDEYTLLRCAFMGGYTHANAFNVGKVIEGVTSQDFTSSYPYVLFSEKYPMSKGELCYPDVEEVYRKLNVYAWILDIELYDVESKVIEDDFISYSRCVKCEGYTLNNGRVNKAKYIHIVVTSVDFQIIFKTYHFYGGVKIIRAYKYFLSYLPTDFINEMLTYYEYKTTLKGVTGKEVEYLHGKENLNSCYGMVVTSPVRPNITYNDLNEWGEEKIDINDGIKKYNKNPNRFLPYVVGVFVTAYARRNLWDGILSVGDDYIYSDTDSIKLTNYEAHKDYFENYNKIVVQKLQQACAYHKIDFSRVAPKTVKGEQKILGVWDFDGYYTRFKTLGAKRYMVEEKDGLISLTVSGLNKKKAIPYLLDKYGSDKIFDAFRDDEFGIDNMQIPKGFSGRNVSTYIDEETRGTITDYLGNKGTYHELSSVHLEESTYTLSLSRDYIRFLFGIERSL